MLISIFFPSQKFLTHNLPTNQFFFLSFFYTPENALRHFPFSSAIKTISFYFFRNINFSLYFFFLINFLYIFFIFKKNPYQHFHYHPKLFFFTIPILIFNSKPKFHFIKTTPYQILIFTIYYFIFISSFGFYFQIIILFLSLFSV